MAGFYIASGFIVAGLFIYLAWALLRPEDFE